MTMPNCPTCKNANSVRQAHRRVFDGIMRLLGRFAFRCDACSTRFYRFFRPKEAETGVTH